MTREVFFEEFELGSVLWLGEQGIEVDLIKILHPVPALGPGGELFAKDGLQFRERGGFSSTKLVDPASSRVPQFVRERPAFLKLLAFEPPRRCSVLDWNRESGRRPSA